MALHCTGKTVRSHNPDSGMTNSNWIIRKTTFHFIFNIMSALHWKYPRQLHCRPFFWTIDNILMHFFKFCHGNFHLPFSLLFLGLKLLTCGFWIYLPLFVFVRLLRVHFHIMIRHKACVQGRGRPTTAALHLWDPTHASCPSSRPTILLLSFWSSTLSSASSPWL